MFWKLSLPTPLTPGVAAVARWYNYALAARVSSPSRPSLAPSPKPLCHPTQAETDLCRSSEPVPRLGPAQPRNNRRCLALSQPCPWSRRGHRTSRTRNLESRGLPKNADQGVVWLGALEPTSKVGVGCKPPYIPSRDTRVFGTFLLHLLPLMSRT